jgi:glycosyltransferase involved in cell wall biosynthesis
VRALAEAAGDIRWPVFVAGSAAHPDGGSVDLAGVEMLGQLDSERLAGWYARASIYALPARYEPFGLTALEAALAGNALVLGDIESLREIWGDAAVFVDPERPAEVADAVNALIDDPGKRRELAERARRRAFELTVDAMAERYTQLYRELCGATVRGPATLTTRGGRH